MESLDWPGNNALLGLQRLKLNCNANTLSIDYSRDIKHLIQEKRNARKRWQETRYPPDKSHLNKLSKKLDTFLQKDKSKNLTAI